MHASVYLKITGFFLREKLQLQVFEIEKEKRKRIPFT